jgi:hypothetical protein
MGYVLLESGTEELVTRVVFAEKLHWEVSHLGSQQVGLTDFIIQNTSGLANPTQNEAQNDEKHIVHTLFLCGMDLVVLEGFGPVVMKKSNRK